MKNKLLKFTLPVLSVGAIAAPIVTLTNCGPTQHLHHYNTYFDFHTYKSKISDFKIRLKSPLSDSSQNIKVDVDYKGLTASDDFIHVIFTDKSITHQEFLLTEQSVWLGIDTAGIEIPRDLKDGANFTMPVKLTCYDMSEPDNIFWTENCKIKIIHQKQQI